jgi:phage terminase small subunit
LNFKSINKPDEFTMDINIIDRRKALLLKRIALIEKQIYYLECFLNVKPSDSLLFSKDNRVSPRNPLQIDPDNLTPKQRRFVIEYCRDLNGARSVKRAGYSPNGAAQMANILLGQPNIVRALRKEYQRITEQNQITADQVIKETAALAYSNIGKFVEWSGQDMKLVSSDYLSQTDLACIKEISEHPGKYGNIVKLKMHDKMAAIRLLATYTGVIGDKVGQGTDADEIGRNIKGAVDKLFDSVPSPEVPQQDLPDNVLRLNDKISILERKVG